VHHRPIKILLVDSEEDRLAETRAVLAGSRPAPIEVEWSGRLADALERLTEGGIDAVLLNLELTDSRGVATFERAHAFAPDVPILVLTDEPDETVAVATVKGGAQDCLVRDELQPPLLARAIRHAVERHRLLAALRSLSLIDELTGLYNRRGFAELGARYLKLARRGARGVTLICLDLDGFKEINERLGHHVGDRALIQAADVLRASFRRSDILARLSADEFAVLALQPSGEEPENLLERVRERVAEFNASTGEEYRLSVSMGMARLDADRRVRLPDLLAEADRAAHEEKQARRSVLQEPA
jgi:diguanylate cyclase (GGDEF)-like protein